MSEYVKVWLSFVLSLGAGAWEQKGTPVEGGVGGGLSGKWYLKKDCGGK